MAFSRPGSTEAAGGYRSGNSRVRMLAFESWLHHFLAGTLDSDFTFLKCNKQTIITLPTFTRGSKLIYGTNTQQ